MRATVCAPLVRWYIMVSAARLSKFCTKACTLDGVTNTTVQQIPVGTLMVDLYDTHTQNLVFRGRAQADLKKNEEKNISLVQKTVDKMFDHFPPKHAM